MGCILPPGHVILVRYSPVRRVRLVVEGHRTADGRSWPRGTANLEFEGTGHPVKEVPTRQVIPMQKLRLRAMAARYVEWLESQIGDKRDAP